jgi:hypothetical protein
MLVIDAQRIANRPIGQMSDADDTHGMIMSSLVSNKFPDVSGNAPRHEDFLTRRDNFMTQSIKSAF